MANRKPIPPDAEHRILDRSRRRCALCVHFHNDWGVKDGQIAHLDRDPSNFTEDNLAYLCLPHHDDYDTKRRQTKNLRIRETKTARDRLYTAVERGELAGAPAVPNTQSADKATLADILHLMNGPTTRFLKFHAFAERFSWDYVAGLITIAQHRREPQHEFLDQELEELREKFVHSAAILLSTLQMSLKPLPEIPGFYGVSSHHPVAFPDQYLQRLKVLERMQTETRAAYELLIRTARQKLG